MVRGPVPVVAWLRHYLIIQRQSLSATLSHPILLPVTAYLRCRPSLRRTLPSKPRATQRLLRKQRASLLPSRQQGGAGQARAPGPRRCVVVMLDKVLHAALLCKCLASVVDQVCNKVSHVTHPLWIHACFAPSTPHSTPCHVCTCTCRPPSM